MNSNKKTLIFFFTTYHSRFPYGHPWRQYSFPGYIHLSPRIVKHVCYRIHGTPYEDF